MNLSGIVVMARPAFVDHVVASLNTLEGVEVHAVDRETGRMVVVQEASGVDSEIEGLKRIKEVEHVAMAELVYHYFGEDPELAPNLENGRSLSGSSKANTHPAADAAIPALVEDTP